MLESLPWDSVYSLYLCEPLGGLRLWTKLEDFKQLIKQQIFTEHREWAQLHENTGDTILSKNRQEQRSSHRN